eukprot:gene9064-16190_t
MAAKEDASRLCMATEVRNQSVAADKVAIGTSTKEDVVGRHVKSRSVAHKTVQDVGGRHVNSQSAADKTVKDMGDRHEKRLSAADKILEDVGGRHGNNLEDNDVTCTSVTDTLAFRALIMAAKEDACRRGAYAAAQLRCLSAAADQISIGLVTMEEVGGRHVQSRSVAHKLPSGDTTKEEESGPSTSARDRGQMTIADKIAFHVLSINPAFPEGDKCAAALQLRDLAVTDGDKVVEAGAGPLLVQLLAPEVQPLIAGAAAEAIGNLALKNPARQAILCAAGAIPPLVAIVSHDNHSVTRANWNWNLLEQTARALGRAIPPLVALLAVGSSRRAAQEATTAALTRGEAMQKAVASNLAQRESVLEAAVAALAHITADNVYNSKKLVAAGQFGIRAVFCLLVVEKLWELVENLAQREDVLEAAAAALVHVTADNVYNSKKLVAAAALAHVTADNVYDSKKLVAAAALAHVTADNVYNSKKLVAAGQFGIRARGGFLW